MKKIAIVFAVLAALLAFSCANPAGGVDLAGNPESLTGSWSGSVAYKSATQFAYPMSFVGTTDTTGTWVKMYNSPALQSDYDKPVSGYRTNGSALETTTTTEKYIFNGSTTTEVTTRVIASDGSYVETVVTTTTYNARAAITPAAGVRYFVNNTNDGLTNAGRYEYVDATNWYSYDLGMNVSSIPKVYGGTSTKTVTTTVTVTSQADGLYSEKKTVQTKYANAGEKYTTAAASAVWTYNPSDYAVTTTTYNYINLKADELSFKAVLSGTDWRQTVKSALSPVEYQNDMNETITFVANEDGTYTLTTVVVTTRAEAAAAAATTLYYAAPARTAATWTTTTTSTGTVAAWETLGTANTAPVTKMVLSATSQKTETVGTGGGVDTTPALATVAKMNAGEYEIRFFAGEGEKDEVTKTRMYVGLNNCVVILDKAVVAEE